LFVYVFFLLLTLIDVRIGIGGWIRRRPCQGRGHLDGRSRGGRALIEGGQGVFPDPVVVLGVVEEVVEHPDENKGEDDGPRDGCAEGHRLGCLVFDLQDGNEGVGAGPAERGEEAEEEERGEEEPRHKVFWVSADVVECGDGDVEGVQGHGGHGEAEQDEGVVDGDIKVGEVGCGGKLRRGWAVVAGGAAAVFGGAEPAADANLVGKDENLDAELGHVLHDVLDKVVELGEPLPVKVDNIVNGGDQGQREGEDEEAKAGHGGDLIQRDKLLDTLALAQGLERAVALGLVVDVGPKVRVLDRDEEAPVGIIGVKVGIDGEVVLALVTHEAGEVVVVVCEEPVKGPVLRLRGEQRGVQDLKTPGRVLQRGLRERRRVQHAGDALVLPITHQGQKLIRLVKEQGVYTRRRDKKGRKKKKKKDERTPAGKGNGWSRYR